MCGAEGDVVGYDKGGAGEGDVEGAVGGCVVQCAGLVGGATGA